MNHPNEVILLTEDGHPIGDLVVANDTSVDTTPATDAENEETTREMMRRTASEMTGDPDADTAVATIFEGIDNEDKRRKAMRLFVAEHMPIAKIAKEVGVPDRTVSAWMFEGKWGEIAAKDVAMRQSASMIEMEVLRTTRRVIVAQEQLDAARKVREAAISKLDADAISVKSAAESLKSASDVEARILGISESGAIDRSDGSSKKSAEGKDGKKPLVVIFTNGGLPPKMG